MENAKTVVGPEVQSQIRTAIAEAQKLTDELIPEFPPHGVLDRLTRELHRAQTAMGRDLGDLSQAVVDLLPTNLRETVETQLRDLDSSSDLSATDKQFKQLLVLVNALDELEKRVQRRPGNGHQILTLRLDILVSIQNLRDQIHSPDETDKAANRALYNAQIQNVTSIRVVSLPRVANDVLQWQRLDWSIPSVNTASQGLKMLNDSRGLMTDFQATLHALQRCGNFSGNQQEDQLKTSMTDLVDTNHRYQGLLMSRIPPPQAAVAPIAGLDEPEPSPPNEFTIVDQGAVIGLAPDDLKGLIERIKTEHPDVQRIWGLGEWVPLKDVELLLEKNPERLPDALYSPPVKLSFGGAQEPVTMNKVSFLAMSELYRTLPSFVEDRHEYDIPPPFKKEDFERLMDEAYNDPFQAAVKLQNLDLDALEGLVGLANYLGLPKEHLVVARGRPLLEPARAKDRASKAALKAEQELLDRVNSPGSSVDLSRCHVTEKVLQALKAHTNLKSLNLANSDLNDDQLSFLKPLTNIVDLNISGTKITEASLETLGTFKGLQILNVSGTDLRAQRTELSDAFSHIAKLPRLADLDVSACRGIDGDFEGYRSDIVNESVPKYLQHLTRLKITIPGGLSVSMLHENSLVPPAKEYDFASTLLLLREYGMSIFRVMPKDIQKLNLSQCTFSDRRGQYTDTIWNDLNDKNLEELDIDGPAWKITNTALDSLGGIGTLKQLKLRKGDPPSFSEEGLNKLLTARPTLEVWVDGVQRKAP